MTPRIRPRSLKGVGFKVCVRTRLGGVSLLTEPNGNWSGAPGSPKRTWDENDMFRMLSADWGPAVSFLTRRCPQRANHRVNFRRGFHVDHMTLAGENFCSHMLG